MVCSRLLVGVVVGFAVFRDRYTVMVMSANPAVSERPITFFSFFLKEKKKTLASSDVVRLSHERLGTRQAGVDAYS